MTHTAVVFSLLLVIAAAAAKKKKPPALAGRIAGGRDTDISEVPYQVSLHYRGEYDCVGSIIAHKYILTAAHCVIGAKPKDFHIRAGSNYTEKEGVTMNVKKIKCHPEYNRTTIDNDIAILQLNEPLAYNKNIKAIALTETEPKGGEDILVSGWGALKENGSYATTLQSVTLKVVDRKTCKKIYPKPGDITDNMFCAGYMEGGKDTCKGDSGGAAVVNGRQAGIVSWGNGCGRKNAPGGYTNIVKYRKWIRENWNT